MSLILALAALTTSEPVTLPNRQAVCDLAITLQILDDRETRYTFAHEEEWATDLELMRKRYGELKDAPRLDEACVLPPRELINDWLSFNRSYRCYLELQAELDLLNWWELRQMVVKCDELYHTLDLVRDAQCDYYYVTVRRYALKRLVEEYKSLNLVPLNFVPLEYFLEVP